MEEDRVIRMKFAGLIATVVTLTMWGMWHLVMVE